MDKAYVARDRIEAKLVADHFTQAEVAVILAAYHAPDAIIGIADTALRGLLGPVLTVTSWALCVVILVLLRRPVLWLVRRAASLARQAWKSIQGDGLLH